MHLVYIQTMVGVQAQKVPELVPNTHNGVARYLATHKLDEAEHGWPIDALKGKYPAPREAVES
jgi:hypothetical protein